MRLKALTWKEDGPRIIMEDIEGKEEMENKREK